MINLSSSLAFDRTTHTTAYINKLPVEVLREIFLMAVVLPAASDSDYDTRPDRHRLEESEKQYGVYLNHHDKDTLLPPLRISHVSRRWRAIVLSFGRLWSHLSITLTDLVHPKSGDYQPVIDVFDTFLERTNGRPLNFSFRCDFDGEEADLGAQSAEYIISTLLSHQRRWRDVRFEWKHLNLSSDFPGIRISDAPILRSFHLDTRLETQDRDIVWAHLSIGKDSRLHALALGGHFVLVFKEPAHALETCALEYSDELRQSPAARTCLNVVKNAPNLQRMNFSSSVLNFPQEVLLDFYDAHTCSTFAYNLKNLYLGLGKNANLIIDRMGLPDLRRLVYQEWCEDIEGTILGFVKRSRPPLTYLEMHSNDCFDIAFIETLRLLPTLVGLRLIGCRVSGKVFEALGKRHETDKPYRSPIENESVVCPNLRSLRLRRVTVGDPGACAAALKSVFELRQLEQKSLLKVILGDVPVSLAVPLTQQGHRRLVREIIQRGDIFVGNVDNYDGYEGVDDNISE